MTDHHIGDQAAAAQAVADATSGLASLQYDAFARRGRDAWDAHPDLRRQAQAIRDDALAGLSPQAAALASQDLEPHWNAAMTALDHHAATQRDAWHDDATRQAIGAAGEHAARTWADEDGFARTLDHVGALTARRGLVAGHDFGTIHDGIRQAAGQVAQARLSAMAAADPAAARAFLDSRPDLFDADTQTSMGPHLDLHARSRAGIDLAGSVAAGLPQGSLDDWLAESARQAGDDGELHGLASAELTTRDAARQAAVAQATRDSRNTLLAATLPGGEGAAPASLAELLGRGTAVHRAWADTSPATRQAVLRRLAVNAGGAEPPLSADTLGTYDHAQGLRLSDPAAFRALDLSSTDYTALPADLHRTLVEQQRQPPDAGLALRLHHRLAMTGLQPPEEPGQGETWLRRLGAMDRLGAGQSLDLGRPLTDGEFAAVAGAAHRLYDTRGKRTQTVGNESPEPGSDVPAVPAAADISPPENAGEGDGKGPQVAQALPTVRALQLLGTTIVGGAVAKKAGEDAAKTMQPAPPGVEAPDLGENPDIMTKKCDPIDLSGSDAHPDTQGKVDELPESKIRDAINGLVLGNGRQTHYGDTANIEAEGGPEQGRKDFEDLVKTIGGDRGKVEPKSTKRGPLDHFTDKESGFTIRWRESSRTGPGTLDVEAPKNEGGWVIKRRYP